MINLLKVEWMKVKNYTAFWILMIIYIVGVLGLNYIAWYINDEALKQPVGEMLLSRVYSFPKVWQTVGFMSSWLLYFPGMLIIMLMANEFNFKTHRQNLIDGWSRKEFIHVKIFMCVVVALFITLLCMFTALLFGFVAGGSFSFSGIEFVGYIFLQALAYMLFALLIAVLLRRSGVAMGIYFIYGLVLEFLVVGLIRLMFFRMDLNDFAGISYFFPLQLSDVLVTNPWADRTFYPGAPSTVYLILGTIGYIGLFYFFITRKFAKDDL
jgi:ABC-2 type transport system permease protein